MRNVDADVLQLRDYLDVLRRQVWAMIVAVVVVVVIALAFTLGQGKMYAASTLMVIQPPSSAGPIEQLLYGSTDLETQIEIITSRLVVERALETAGVRLDTSSPRSISEFIEDHLEVSPVDNTTVIEVVVTAEEPEASAALSRAVADAYLTYLREDAEERSREAVVDLGTQEETVRNQLRSVQAQLAQEPGSTRASLEEERDNLQAQLRWIATRRVELDSVQAFMRRGDIVQPALVPEAPVSPQPLRTGVLALVLGAMLGVGVAFVRDAVDDRVSSCADVRRAAGSPPLAVLDFTSNRGDVDEEILVLRRHLAATLLQRQPDGTGIALAGRVIQLAAVADDTDPTALVDRLSSSFERAGHRVVTVDLVGGTDEPPPAAASPGLSHYLSSRIGMADLLSTAGDQPSRRLAAHDAGSEELTSPRMAALLDELRHRYGVVLVLTPPVTISAASLDIGAQCDATVLAVTVRRTRYSQMQDAITRLDRVDAPIAGVVAMVGSPPPRLASPQNQHVREAPPAASTAGTVHRR